MTAQEKAEQLVKEYLLLSTGFLNAKRSALITVGQIIDEIYLNDSQDSNNRLNYWIDVMEEIDK